MFPMFVCVYFVQMLFSSLLDPGWPGEAGCTSERSVREGAGFSQLLL